jgi:hypothetical protein
LQNRILDAQGNYSVQIDINWKPIIWTTWDSKKVEEFREDDYRHIADYIAKKLTKIDQLDQMFESLDVVSDSNIRNKMIEEISKYFNNQWEIDFTQNEWNRRNLEAYFKTQETK